MKTLSDYTNDAMTALFKETGSFFAFGDKQFNEKRQEGVDYVGTGWGLIMPKDRAKEVLLGLKKIHEAGIAQDIAENGITAIIERELYNHEAFYTWEIDQTVDALEDYPITREQIQAKFEELAAQQ